MAYSAASIQDKVNDIFKKFPSDHTHFSEFSRDSKMGMRDLLLQFGKADVAAHQPQYQPQHQPQHQPWNQQLLQSIPSDSGKGLEDVIEIALDKLNNKKVDSRLVKLALAVFLTHNLGAQKLNVGIPHLAELNEFRSTEVPDLPQSNPVTADNMCGVEILAYFREDYDLNDHHYSWHQVYPSGGINDPNQPDKLIRSIDRQGELFLYMHSQMIARYNAESLGWNLDMTHSWSYDDVVTFGYTPCPGLRAEFGARPPFRGWYEDHNPNLTEDQATHFPSKDKIIFWKDNLFRGILNSHFLTIQKSDGKAGEPFKLTEENEMNWVGIVVEAEDEDLQEVQPGVFINHDEYGSIHNSGHNKFAEIGYHQYTSKSNNLGVMGSNHATPRDPCFWLWHRHIDDFRQEVVKKYKHDLYHHAANAKILELKICPQKPSDTPKGGIATYLGPPQLEKNEVNAKLTHESYQWELTVESTLDYTPSVSTPQNFTARVFIAPKVLIQDQRAWIEMDKFNVKLTKKTDTVFRLDTESSVARKPPPKNASPYCKCGWPQNLMLPVGKPGGMEYVAFAILTYSELAKGNKYQTLSFCGSKDHKYPDPRGMGYPFNKTWNKRVHSTAPVEEIIEKLPHTKLSYFTIYRYTKLYNGNTIHPHHPGKDITWEKDVKNFFTPKDIYCMKRNGPRFDLSKKDDVIQYASIIYQEVKDRSMPLGESKWKQDKVDEFNQWMQDGYP